MFRWPVSLTPLSLGSNGAARDVMLEVTPRGAVFTLAALAQVGHAAHLAVIDAYLKGQFRPAATVGIGEDSRLVLSALAAPLVAGHELGTERLTLADLILLPGDLTPQPPLRRGDEEPVRSADSVRFLLRGAGGWRWVRASELFEAPGCLGTPQPGLGSGWDDVIVQAPPRPFMSEMAPMSRGLPPTDAELRAATLTASVSDDLVSALQALGLARFARSGVRVRATAFEAARLLTLTNGAASPLAAVDLTAEARSWAAAPSLSPVESPAALAATLAEAIITRRPVETALTFQGAELGVSLTPDLDGYQTLCLLPPSGSAATASFERMRAAAWATIEALIGRPLAEYRTEAIMLRLVAADGRTTTLEIGASIVIVRNQTVFTGWVGSDGRVMLKLFPPGGMIRAGGAAGGG